ncbi:hypothetical protein ATO8_21211, partial [Roseivivax marinus]
EAGALRKGWASMTDDQWDALAVERGGAPEAPQGDLFDAELPLAAAVDGRRNDETAPNRLAKPARRRRKPGWKAYQ